MIAMVSCRSVKGFSSKPANAPLADQKLVDVDVFAYHVNDSVTQIFYRILSENLMYRKIDSTQNFYATVFVSCSLMPDINSRTILDSASSSIVYKFQEEAKPIQGTFTLKLKQTEFAYLDLYVIDKNKNIKYSKPIYINKRNSSVEQNYILATEDGIAYTTCFERNKQVKVRSNRNTGSELSIDCFFKEFPLALPPFSSQKIDELKYKPDSSFVWKMDSSVVLNMPESGFYHLRSNKQLKEGLSLHTYERSFPGVSDVTEMIKCTRYIMSKEEYDNCMNASDQKACIDDFWKAIAGSNERAKELLRKYYGRVKESNKRYTSYTQGWRTDRGMIYVVFGEPINVYKSKQEEIWIYGPEIDVNTLKFVFKRTENPFSSNDYILQRSSLYKESWYSAVDYWRQGRVSVDR